MSKEKFTYKLKKMTKLETKLHSLGCKWRADGLSTHDVLSCGIGFLLREIEKINKRLDKEARK